MVMNSSVRFAGLALQRLLLLVVAAAAAAFVRPADAFAPLAQPAAADKNTKANRPAVPPGGGAYYPLGNGGTSHGQAGKPSPTGASSPAALRPRRRRGAFAWSAIAPTSIVYPVTTSSFMMAASATTTAAEGTDQDQSTVLLSDEDEEILFGTDDVASATTTRQRRAKDKFGNALAAAAGTTNPLDHASDPRINKLHTVRDMLEACPYLWKELAEILPNQRAVLDEHLCDTKVDYTFAEMSQVITQSAMAFRRLGIGKGDNVAILGENSAYWLIADHGIQMAGGTSAVRGADAPVDELRYIYEHSDSKRVAVLQGPKLLRKLGTSASATGDHHLAPLGLYNDQHGPVETVVLMHREKQSDEQIAEMAKKFGVKVLLFSDLLEAMAGEEASSGGLDTGALPRMTRDDIATIVYTSGTTGRPKGVVLSHGNLIHQTGHRLAPTRPFEEVEPCPGHVTVSLLPVWHITERTFELWMLSRGCTVVYSSIRTFRSDLAKHRPQWLVLVPRVLEKIAKGVQDKFSSGSAAVKTLAKLFTAVGNTVCKHKKIVDDLVVGYEKPDGVQKLFSQAILTVLNPVHAVGNKLVWSKVQDGFGGNVKTIISGGSALAGSLETFYETAGLQICVGYGLTECSPIISFRRGDANLVTPGCAGKACAGTELRVVDPDVKPEAVKGPRPAVPIGDIGVVLVKGPPVMQGYYKNKKATDEAIDSYGYFNTGDLGRINPVTGDLILTGRAKDTIVLSNGENIEPLPIEDAILGSSDIIEQVMLYGQDGRRLIAICVLNPNELYNAGYITDKNEATRLQSANEKVNDPKCDSIEDAQDCINDLNEVSKNLRRNQDLKQALVADITRATSTGAFRKWEQVSEVYITLEPFAMVNGQLTQSYKVKRNAVADRYADELPK